MSRTTSDTDWQRRVDRAWTAGYRAGIAEERTRRRHTPAWRALRWVWANLLLVGLGGLCGAAMWLYFAHQAAALEVAATTVVFGLAIAGWYWAVEWRTARRRF